MQSKPVWLVEEPFEDVDLGVLKSGKEAQISLWERTSLVDGRSCLLAAKLYLPRKATSKGQLEAMGVQRASAFRHDVEYREGRQFRKSRDRRAVERMTAHGRSLMQARWTNHEFDIMTKLWVAGVPLPYPVTYDDDLFLMEYVGERTGAAQQLAVARLDDGDLDRAWAQIEDGLVAMVAAGIAHGDLSAYNLLWWQDRVWFIDFPQAVDIAANPQGQSYLHRDVANLSEWFNRRGLHVEPDEVFAMLLEVLAGAR